MVQVISRIFYTVDRSWSNRITVSDLRRSNFLQVCVRERIGGVCVCGKIGVVCVCL